MHFAKGFQGNICQLRQGFLPILSISVTIDLPIEPSDCAPLPPPGQLDTWLQLSHLEASPRHQKLRYKD